MNYFDKMVQSSLFAFMTETSLKRKIKNTWVIRNNEQSTCELYLFCSTVYHKTTEN